MLGDFISFKGSSTIEPLTPNASCLRRGEPATWWPLHNFWRRHETRNLS